MKHFIILLVVALITLGITFALYRPELIEDIWLWIIGLIGPIIGIFQVAIKSVSKFFKNLNIDEE